MTPILLKNPFSIVLQQQLIQKIESITIDNTNGKLKSTTNGIEKEYPIDGLLSGVTRNPNNGDITFTLKGGQTLSVNIPKDDFVESGYYDEDTKELVLVMTMSGEVRIPASSLIDVYVGGSTNSVIVMVSGKTVTGCIDNYLQKTENGLKVPNFSPYGTTEENDAKYLGKESQAKRF